MLARLRRSALVLVLVGGCDSGTTQAPSEPAAPVGPAPADPVPSVPTQALEARLWTSASCADRAYPRTLAFAGDGTFVARDLVSPCPEGAQCVWSGIVERKGTYTATADRIALALQGNEPAPAAKALPTELRREASGAPAEVDAGGTRCVYAHEP
jgi:hypothetical protein